MNGYIMLGQLFRAAESRVAYFAGLDEALDPALIPEVGTAQLLLQRCKSWPCRRRALGVRVSEAYKEDLAAQDG